MREVIIKKLKPILSLALILTSLSGWVFAECPDFEQAKQVGSVTATQLTEISGLVASKRNPGLFWVHNDSGSQAIIYAIDFSGEVRAVYSLPTANSTDWEDIALGPGPNPGTSYLYIGDIGDNNAVRSSICVYRVAEPLVNRAQPVEYGSLSGVEQITLTYPDGARDAETLLIDPLNTDLYVISKREFPSRVYLASFPQSTYETNQMVFKGTLPWGWAVGGDVSRSGLEIIVRGYYNASLWQRDPEEQLWSAFSSTTCSIPLASEQQGEAIGFDSAGRGYLTISEGQNVPLYYYTRTTAMNKGTIWEIY